jgi:hypothetical protein
VLALHPRYVLDERENTLTELDEADESAVLDDAPHLSMSAGANVDEQDSAREEPPKVRLLVREDVLKWVRDDFMLASTAAELLEADTLGIRAATDQLDGAVVATEETVVSLLTPDAEHSAALVTDDEEFVEAARERWQSSWEDGAAFDLRTPAYTRAELARQGVRFGDGDGLSDGSGVD